MAAPKRVTIKNILQDVPEEYLKNFNSEGFLDEEQKMEEQFRNIKETARKTEEERIAKMKCPFCKSKLKTHFVQAKSNGICGPGHYSRIQIEYYICLDCGIHYSDLNKPSNE